MLRVVQSLTVPRIIDDLMFYTKEKNLSGLLLAIDFEKAFDSLDWIFLNKVLSAFNFGQSFIKWVNTFYCNIPKLRHEQWLFFRSF